MQFLSTVWFRYVNACSYRTSNSAIFPLSAISYSSVISERTLLNGINQGEQIITFRNYSIHLLHFKNYVYGLMQNDPGKSSIYRFILKTLMRISLMVRCQASGFLLLFSPFSQQHNLITGSHFILDASLLFYYLRRQAAKPLNLRQDKNETFSKWSLLAFWFGISFSTHGGMDVIHDKQHRFGGSWVEISFKIDSVCLTQKLYTCWDSQR